jgi:hypothetical protein
MTENATVASVRPVVDPRLFLIGSQFGTQSVEPGAVTFAARLTKNSVVVGAVGGVVGGVHELPCTHARWSY